MVDIASKLTSSGQPLWKEWANKLGDRLGVSTEQSQAEKFGWVPFYGDYKRYQAQINYNREYEQRTGYTPYSYWLGGSGHYSNPSHHLGRIFSSGLSYTRRGLRRGRNRRRNYRR